MHRGLPQMFVMPGATCCWPGLMPWLTVLRLLVGAGQNLRLPEGKQKALSLLSFTRLRWGERRVRPTDKVSAGRDTVPQSLSCQHLPFRLERACMVQVRAGRACACRDALRLEQARPGITRPNGDDGTHTVGSNSAMWPVHQQRSHSPLQHWI